MHYRRPKMMLISLLLLSSTTLAAQSPPRVAARPMSNQRVVLITGSTDGLGREVALRVAATGAHVIVHGRNRERGAEVVRDITKAGLGSAAFIAADFASLDIVHAFADTILARYPRIDVLVNNAGVWLRQGPRQTSVDGYEMTFAVNYLAGYVLTRKLLPRMITSAPSRIVFVASQTQSPLDFSDVMQEQSYSGQRAYSQSKLAQVMFSFDLARELADSRVSVIALHPATLMDTRMVEGAGVQPRSTIDEGADAVMFAIADPTVASGVFLTGTRVSRANGQAYDDSARAQLRAISERLASKKR